MQRTLSAAALVFSGLAITLAAQVAPATPTRISGTVRDLCGSVMPGAIVSAASRDGINTGTPTDEFGRYVLQIEPALWTLTFSLTGFQEHRQDVIVVPGSDVELNIRLPLAGPVEMISTPGPKARYQRYAVQGLVRGADGAAIPQAIIRLRAKRPSQFVIGSDVCTSDDEGRYTTVGWSTKPIRWRMSVEAKDYRPADFPDVDLTADETKTIDIRLERR
jgi:hypothetical protein